MPYINIRLGTTLANEQRNQLYQQTTHLMQSIMHKRAEVTVVHIQESDPNQWSTNVMMLSQTQPIGVYVDIKVTEGTNTEKEKADMLSQTVIMLQDVVGTIQEACYVVIDDIPSHSWGYNGISQKQRALDK